MKKIGETEYEIDAGKMLECRQIVKNLNAFGVNEKQKVQIIYLLALELESKNAMDIFVKAVKKVKSLDQNVFLFIVCCNNQIVFLYPVNNHGPQHYQN